MSSLRWSTSLLAPSLIFLGALFVGPFVYMIWLSFTDLSFAAADRNGNWVGFANYSRAIFEDSVFFWSLGRSILFALLCVGPQVLFGIAVAEALHRYPFAQRMLSPLFALPALIPTVAVGLYWRLMLQGEFGVLSYYLSAVGFPFAKGILSDAQTILVTLALIDFWQWGPFTALVFLAARSSISSVPLEAAYVDGASRWRAFYDVTLPALYPTIFLVSVIRAIDSFKEFDKVFVMTGGGPGTASELISIYTWRTAFKQWEFGYGAALCIVVYLLIYFGTQLTLMSAKKGAN